MCKVDHRALSYVKVLNETHLLNSISAYRYDFFSFTDVPRFAMYRNLSVAQTYDMAVSSILLQYNAKTGF